ncbi:PWWP domain-containing protein 2A [Armadillidium vulgare]|nr:PWWP domain-containing protein 2A [Armadillidium vulgare]
MEEQNVVVGKNISVKVEEFLPDLILVSFKNGKKLYQGILLDATNRSIPCGDLNFNNKSQPEEYDSSFDKLYTIKQRYTYFHTSGDSFGDPEKRPLSKKVKNSRMTVRLRPRQVLCSNCQSICNENSEKVITSKQSKCTSVSKNNPQKQSNNNNSSTSNNNINKELRSSRETRQSVNMVNSSSCNMLGSHSNSQVYSSPVLVPRLIKLKPSDIESATSVKQEQASSSENEGKPDDVRLPKLKLISGLSPKKTKGKFLKMTISASNTIENGDNKKGGIRTRSHGSLEDKVTNSDLTNNKPSNTNVVHYKSSLDDEMYEIEDVTTSGNVNRPPPDFVDNDVQTSIGDSNHVIMKQKSDKTEKTKNGKKKRSVECDNEGWKEIFNNDNKRIKSLEDEASCPSSSSENCDSNVDLDKPKQTPILKISFGPGKGTVLKIPAKSTVSENDSTESEDQVESSKSNTVTKAAKKALKKARREAQKKKASAGNSVFFNKTKLTFAGKSPIKLGGLSPARIGGFSPGRFGGASPGRFGGASPSRFGGASPSRFGGASPGRFSGASPGRFSGASPGRFGNTSPGRFGNVSPARFQGMMSPRSNVDFLRTQSKKHKHKVKHKKRHKDERKHKSDENSEPNNSLPEPFEIKEESEPLSEKTNLDSSVEKIEDLYKNKQTDSPDPSNNDDSPPYAHLQTKSGKLDDSCSTNFNFISHTQDSHHEHSKTNSFLEYDSCSNKTIYEENNFNYLNITSEPEIGSNLDQTLDDTNLRVPNFPWIPNNLSEEDEDTALLWMKLTWHDVDSIEASEGYLRVGDVVWGKIDDFPWWPAKIIRLKESNGTCKNHQAQVCWYGTSSSSLLLTEDLQPFLKKYNVSTGKGRGPYQDAVREASLEADQILKDAEQHLNICESPITASPREVDVVS